jgi:hypothetical protein
VVVLPPSFLKNNRDCSLPAAVGVKGDCDKTGVLKDTCGVVGGGDDKNGDDDDREDDEDGEDDDAEAAPRKTGVSAAAFNAFVILFSVLKSRRARRSR